MEICRTALGENHPRYATSLNNLADLYHAMGDRAAALPFLHQAAESYARRWGRTTHIIADCLSSLASVYRNMGDHTAAPLCRQAVEICRATLGEDHPPMPAA